MPGRCMGKRGIFQLFWFSWEEEKPILLVVPADFSGGMGRAGDMAGWGRESRGRGWLGWSMTPSLAAWPPAPGLTAAAIWAVADPHKCFLHGMWSRWSMSSPAERDQGARAAEEAVHHALEEAEHEVHIKELITACQTCWLHFPPHPFIPAPLSSLWATGQWKHEGFYPITPLFSGAGIWAAAPCLPEVEGIFSIQGDLCCDLLAVRWQSSPCCATSHMHIHGSFVQERNYWIRDGLKDTDHAVEIYSSCLQIRTPSFFIINW